MNSFCHTSAEDNGHPAALASYDLQCVLSPWSPVSLLDFSFGFLE